MIEEEMWNRLLQQREELNQEIKDLKKEKQQLEGIARQRWLRIHELNEQLNDFREAYE